MSTRLGKHQLCLLATMASPFSILIVLDKLARSLEERGLLASRVHPRDKEKSFCSITPAGLRVLAEALERGAIEQFFDPRFQRDRVRIYFDGRKPEKAEG